jgi:serine/threonine protein kinase
MAERGVVPVAPRIILGNPLALATGTRLGPYDIIAALGAGGMGEVYRVRDTKLNRDVALKILPDSFTDDTDRVARFRREAQRLASLNHPHIAAIYGFEEIQDPTTSGHSMRALVLELVNGESGHRGFTFGRFEENVGLLEPWRLDANREVKMFFKKPKPVACAVCGNPIEPKERRFVEKNRVAKVERHVHLDCHKPIRSTRATSA